MQSWKLFRGGILAAAASLLFGCRPSGGEYFPLRVGERWEYQAITRSLKSAPDVTVSRETAVGGSAGFELVGPQGISRLAWVGQRLVASELAGTAFNPPLPLLDATVPPGNVTWHGIVRNALSSGKASAILSHENATTTVGGVRQAAIKTFLTLQIGHHRLDLQSFWVRGIGLAEQTQRTDGNHDVELSWLKGPTFAANPRKEAQD